MTKTMTFRFRCTEDEAAEIYKRAAAHNRTASDYARLTLTGKLGNNEPTRATDLPGGHVAMPKTETQRMEVRMAEVLATSPPPREFRPFSKAEQAGRKPK